MVNRELALNTLVQKLNREHCRELARITTPWTLS
jgi:hypothetical protein